MAKYHLTYHLIEGSKQEAQQFCENINRNATPYARRKYPAHYTPYKIENNDGNGNDWNGWICWYHYAVG